MGVGPFYLLEHIPFGQVYFRGKPLALDMSVAVAQWGEMQIELIEQHDTNASIYTEFSSRHAEGLQHVGVMTASLDEHLDRLRPHGIESRYSGVRQRTACALPISTPTRIPAP